MNPSLKNILALVFIMAGTVFTATQLNSFIKTQQDEKAKTVIINAIAMECRELKKQTNNTSSFRSSSLAINRILGNGIQVLDENTYLRLISLCYDKTVVGDKI